MCVGGGGGGGGDEKGLFGPRSISNQLKLIAPAPTPSPRYFKIPTPMIIISLEVVNSWVLKIGGCF